VVLKSPGELHACRWGASICQFAIVEGYVIRLFSLGAKIANHLPIYGTMNVDLNSLKIFAEIVDAGSLSEASRRLKMPVSTVSRRLSELEDQLKIRLLERSTRNLRLTDVGSEVLEHARRTEEVSDAIDSVVTSHTAEVTGTLRLASPPSISDSLIAPLIGAFQEKYPNVRVQVFITDRIVDQIAEGVDVAFRVGALPDSTLVARRLLTYRHQVVASPAYLKRNKHPKTPQDLLHHRLLAFFWRSRYSWNFTHASGKHPKTISFEPYIGMNDYSGLAAALLDGAGIGELPPIVQPELMRKGLLVEVMPAWHLDVYDLSLIHLGNRYIPRHVRVFKEFAVEMSLKLFPKLPA
jgi:DNA-binding transcriptional LysR family regulator